MKMKKSLLGCFDNVVSLYGVKTAISYKEIKLSYNDVNYLSNKVANYFKSLGISDKSVIGIYMKRSPLFIVTYLASVKLGSCILPLNIEDPPARITDLLQDSSADFFICDEIIDFSLELKNVKKITLNSFSSIKNYSNEFKITTKSTDTNIIYKMYTSGSTGKSKGIAITEKGIMRLLNDTTIDIHSQDKVLHMAPIAFDASTFEIWIALLNGAELLIYDEETSDIDKIINFIKNKEISIVWLTAGYLYLIENKHFSKLQNLRYLIAGGDILPLNKVLMLHNGLKNCQIINGYGPTENTTFSTFYKVNGQEKQKVPIGKPLIDTKVFVVNENLEQTKINEIGEILLGGDGLAVYYINQPKLTAENFIPNSFSGKGDRLYRTGDYGLINEDGNLVFIGRMDSQYKKNGYRIELEEIKSMLLTYPNVKECVITFDKSEESELLFILKAFIIPYDRSNINLASSLDAFLRKKIPSYMIPNQFILLKEIPITLNGKVDISTLKNIQSSSNSPTKRHMGNKELIVNEILCNTLNIREYSVGDSFFSLGGNSLLAIKIISKIKSKLGIDISIKEFMESPTLSHVQALIIEKPINAKVQSIKYLELEKIPLSSSQERIWYLQDANPNLFAYNAQAIIQFIGDLNLEVFLKSINQLISRNEILRTSFINNNNNPTQLIHNSYVISEVSYTDYTNIIDQVKEQNIVTDLKCEFQTIFNLEELPLIKWKIIRVEKEKYLISQVEHHIIHDGWSLKLLINELFDIYQQYLLDEETVFPTKKYQFKDIILSQINNIKENANSIDFWKNKLKDSEGLLKLPYDFNRPKNQSYQGDILVNKLNKHSVSKLKEISKKENISIFSLLLSIFNLVLHAFSNSANLTIGTSIANRNTQEMEEVLGMFVNNISINTIISDINSKSFLDYSKEVYQELLETYEHSELPFDDVVSAVNPIRDSSYHPIFQVMFNMHDAPIDLHEYTNFKLNVTEGISRGSAKFDLSVITVPENEEMKLVWEYNTGIFKKETVIKFLNAYSSIIELVIDNETIRLADIKKKLGDSPIEGKLVDLNSNNILSDIRKSVQNSPNKIAIEDNNKGITYKELDDLSDNLANNLIKNGVIKGTVVGVFMHRSIDAIVSILAIWKVRGIYLPINPDFPIKRIKNMINDSKAESVLVEKMETNLNFVNQIIYQDTPIQNVQDITMQTAFNLNSNNDNAYIIYTSGSTGISKGILVGHGALSNNLSWMKEEFNISSNNRVLQTTVLTFDPSLWEIFLPLISGGTVVICPYNYDKDSQKIKELLETKDINVLSTSPSMLSEILEEEVNWKKVDYIFCGGNVLTELLANRFLELNTNSQLINLYGPSEACIDVTFKHITNVQEISIGKPINNVTLYILDEDLIPVPEGAKGELCISGLSLAAGYINNQAKTAENFKDNPFIPGSKIYKTGDIVRKLPNNEIEYIGRNDKQTNIRGLRVELKGIEEEILKLPNVKEAFVCTKKINNLEVIAAYVILYNNSSNFEVIRNLLGEILPQYMLPDLIMELSKFPTKDSGKIDEEALPVEIQPKNIKNLETVSELKLSIKEIWIKYLNQRNILTTDNFFNLGGNSIIGMKICRELKKKFNIDIFLEDIFAAPTINDLSYILEDRVKNINKKEPLNPEQLKEISMLFGK